MIIAIIAACGTGAGPDKVPDCWDYAALAVEYASTGLGSCDEDPATDEVMDGWYSAQCEAGDDACTECIAYYYTLGLHACTVD